MMYAAHPLVVIERYNITILKKGLLWTVLHDHCRFTALTSFSLLFYSLLPFNCCNTAIGSVSSSNV